MKPKNVRKIDRRRDRFHDVENLPQWEKRGVKAVTASSIVGTWFRSTDSKVAPMEREFGEYWLQQFEGMGQFEAFSSWDAADKATPQTMLVEPAYDLKPPALLYRGASEKLKDRWSWAEEPETAQAFIDLFCPEDGKIWVAEAETVFGVIRAHIENPEPPLDMSDFTEWIAIPQAATIHEWSAQGTTAGH